MPQKRKSPVTFGTVRICTYLCKMYISFNHLTINLLPAVSDLTSFRSKVHTLESKTTRVSVQSSTGLSVLPLTQIVGRYTYFSAQTPV